MNEYQDQVSWFRLETLSLSGRWVMVSDHDTAEEADDAMPHPDTLHKYRVRRMSGLPE